MNKGDRPGVGEAEPEHSPNQLVNSFSYATTWVKIKNRHTVRRSGARTFSLSAIRPPPHYDATILFLWMTVSGG